VALCLPLALRRRAPRAVVGMVAVATAALWLLDPPDTMTAFAGGLALYTLGRHVERPASLVTFAVVGGGLIAVGVGIAAHGGGSAGWVALVGRVGVILGTFWFGDAQRSRHALLEAAADRARRAEGGRREAERQAVLEERARIARELHDVVAHALSVMVVQATAASRLMPADPAAAAEAVDHVVDVGRSALGEMRHVLGALDDRGTADHAPLPRLSDLDPLVDRCRAAGLSVRMERLAADGEGKDGDDGAWVGDELPVGVQLSVVRVVQESLTNVMKHAPRSRATVRLQLAAARGELTVEVTNDGSVVGDAPHGRLSGPGRGLIGLRERVEALGGSFSAGPRPEGGFAVRAVIPTAGAA